MKFVAQNLMGDRRPIAEYDNAQLVPFPLDKPLTRAEMAPFVDKRVLVTFTVRVPLADVAFASQGRTLARHIEKSFLSRTYMSNPEYRAVGATFEDFDKEFSGYVHLQVTCELTSTN